MKEISRLRRKFIIYNMLIVTAVIGITFAALVCVLQSRGDEESRLILERAVEQPGERLIFDAVPQVRLPYFSVLVTENGEVIMRDGAYNSFPGAGYLERLAFLGMAAEADDGILDGYQLRYLRVEQPAGHLLVFADTSYGDIVRDALLRYGGLACAAIWLVFLGLSFLFSHWVVRPIAQSLRLQKQFVADASHELKTPIALIQGYAEGLTEGMAEDPESRDYYCEVIMDEANKMNKMVKQLLTLSALESGNDAPVMERFDLTELIRGVVTSAQILISQKAVSVEFQRDAPCYVWADEFKIEEVVTNYLNNAINHADGERRIVITLQENGGEVCVSVFNTGNHIPEEDLPNLWTKFYKVDKARTRAYGGSGIGLSIVKAIMDSHQKQCGVENVDGGARFWFTLDCSRG